MSATGPKDGSESGARDGKEQRFACSLQVEKSAVLLYERPLRQCPLARDSGED